MANRFPLVLDTTDGNKIKELPATDNLNLRESSIVNVQNIDALGTINAPNITVNGQKLVAQNFADLTDTPNSFVGSENYFIKVNETGTGIEFRPLGDIGNIDVSQITTTQNIIPAVDGTGNVGTNAAKFNQVVANELVGDLVAFDGTLVFDASTAKVSYAALQGAPRFLSEFTDDIGYLRQADLDSSISDLFDEGRAFKTDIIGSVFADDSTVIVDAISGRVLAPVNTTTVDADQITANVQTVSPIVETNFIRATAEENLLIESSDNNEITIGESNTSKVTIFNAEASEFNVGTDLGAGEIYGATDLILSAGNRIKFTGAPVRVPWLSDTDLLSVVAQEGDVIYNTTGSRLQMYQGGAWKDVNGNVEATTGQSDFNDVVVAGNLTVSGTTTTVDTTNTTITDNVIVLNNGETGAGVTAGTSGIEIDRGSEANKTLVWDETDDKWTVGSETFVAGTVEAVGLQSSFLGNGGQNSPLQLSSGLEGQTGNTIFINPQGSDTLVQMWGETINLVTGPFNTYDSPYMQFKTEGAFKAHQGAYFDGKLVGDVTGSVFGDDSTILVDGVNGKIVGNVNTSLIETNLIISQGGNFNPTGQTLNIGAANGSATGGTVIVGGGTGTAGDGGTALIGGGTGSAGNGGTASVTGGTGSVDGGTVFLSGGTGSVDGGKAYMNGGSGIAGNGGGVLIVGGPGSVTDGVIDIGTEATSAINIGEAGVTTTTIDGTFNATLTGNVVGNVTGDVSGNIDNTTLNIGATATTVSVGNATSETILKGGVRFDNALIVNNITADDSISILTGGTTPNEAISLGPQGSNTAINLTADNIRLNGTITTTINADGGVIGDLQGSVYGDDSATIIDGVNSTVVGDINNTNTTTANLKTPEIRNNDVSDDLDITVEGFLELFGGTTNAGLSKIQLDTQGLNYIELQTVPNDPGNVSDKAIISINAQTTSGDVIIGNSLTSRNQQVEIHNATVYGDVIGTLTGSVNGTVTGDLTGSVFGDDSTPIIDGPSGKVAQGAVFAAAGSFDNTGTTLGTTTNISSLGYDGGTGTYTVNFASDLPSANYIVNIQITGSVGEVYSVIITNKTVSAIEYQIYNTSGIKATPQYGADIMVLQA
jgi:hypothetical protein